MRHLILSFLAAAIFVPGLALSQVKLPKTPVREVTEDYFGTKVSDPYRSRLVDEGPKRLHA